MLTYIYYFSILLHFHFLSNLFTWPIQCQHMTQVLLSRSPKVRQWGMSDSRKEIFKQFGFESLTNLKNLQAYHWQQVGWWQSLSLASCSLGWEDEFMGYAVDTIFVLDMCGKYCQYPTLSFSVWCAVFHVTISASMSLNTLFPRMMGSFDALMHSRLEVWREDTPTTAFHQRLLETGM